LIILIVLENIFLALNRGSFLDPDLGWRLRLGQYMVQSGHLPTNFVGYNYYHNLVFVDHQWLSNLLIYLAYEKWGYYSLFALCIIIFSLTSIILYKICLKKSTFLAANLAVILFLTTVSQTYYGFRLQYIIYLATAIIMYVNEFVTDYIKRFIIYLILFILGSNLHGGGFLILVPVVVLLESTKLFDKETIKAKLKHIGESALLAISLLLAMSVNPYGFNFWKTMWDYIVDPYYKANIAEWHSIMTLPINWIYLTVFAILFFLLTVEKNWKRIERGKLLLFIAVMYFAYSSKRTMPLFVLLVVPEVCLLLKDGLKKISKKISIIAIAVALAVAAFILIANSNGKEITLPIKDPFDISFGSPKMAMEFLKKNIKINGNLYNYYGWGGYITWEYPEQDIFIDGRAPQAFLTDRRATILREYQEIEANINSKVLEEYNIDYILVRKVSPYQCTIFDKKVLLAKCNSSKRYVNGISENYINMQDKNVLDKIFEDPFSVIFKVN